VCDTGNDRVQASSAPVMHMLRSRFLIDWSHKEYNRTHALHISTNWPFTVLNIQGEVRK
jgi:hypothetical protein